MDTVDPARFIFASFFVLGLIGLLAASLRYYTKKSFGQKFFFTKIFPANQETGRLAIIETSYIDHKSKILLIKRDDIEHLLLVADGNVTVIESGIKLGLKNDA